MTDEKTKRRGVKSDSHARQLWGDAYAAIPKSVFATLAFYLAGHGVDSADDRKQVEEHILAELDALSGQIIPERQGNAAVKAFRAAIAKASTNTPSPV